jgi:hypothetical protein
MTPEETLKQLRIVQEQHKEQFVSTGQVRIFDMARDAADAIEAMQTLPEAMKILFKALLADKGPNSYYYSWQSNIACAIMDTFPKEKYFDEFYELHTLANEAAKRFLDNLIS